MRKVERLKAMLTEGAAAIPITDKSGMPVGFAETGLFVSEGLRLAARISLANGAEEPITAHCQELYRRRGSDAYAKAYVATVWELQGPFFGPSLKMLMARVQHAGDPRQGFVDGFDNEADVGPSEP